MCNSRRKLKKTKRYTIIFKLDNIITTLWDALCSWNRTFGAVGDRSDPDGTLAREVPGLVWEVAPDDNAVVVALDSSVGRRIEIRTSHHYTRHRGAINHKVVHETLKYPRCDLSVTSTKEDTCFRRCLFVRPLATLRKNFPTDLHEIFSEGWK